MVKPLMNANTGNTEKGPDTSTAWTGMQLLTSTVEKGILRR